MISLKLSDRAEKLKIDFTKWIASSPPPVINKKIELSDYVNIAREWQAKLAADHWVALHWPEQFGGRGLSLLEEAVIQECLAEARSPQLVNLFGLTMVGPVIIKYGTSEQKKRFLSKILTAEEIWCQGFSEPGAGSDLAAVSTFAVKECDDWKITGEKVWTSFAQYADWCFMLVKTDTASERYRNLSYLLVPMKSAGITVRPLKQISGDEEFNEIFLDNVEVAGKNIVGQVGEGWKIAISTLMHERVILTFARHLQSEIALKEIGEVLKNSGASELEHFEYGRLLSRSMAVRALALSHLVKYENAEPGPEGSLDKLAWSETFQEISRFGLKMLSKMSNEDRADLEQAFTHRYLYSRGRTIAAGTSEIQRNIIAERILGLPKG